MTEENKQANVKITVDNKATEELVKILKEKEQKEKDPESDLAERKLQAIQKFGRAELWTQATSKEMLSDMITNFINSVAERANPTSKPSGSAPANAQQYGQKPENLYSKPYSSHQEMIEDLRKKSSEGNEEAKQYLDSLFKKYVLDKRSNPTRGESSHNPNSPESLLDLGLKQKDGFLTPANPEDGDLGQLQKKWREMRKRRMEGNTE